MKTKKEIKWDISYQNGHSGEVLAKTYAEARVLAQELHPNWVVLATRRK